MNIYQKVKRFHRISGAPYDVKELKETRCDFSGRVVSGGERGEDYPAYYCKFVLDYEDQDSCMGSSGDEYDFGQEFNVDMFEFLNQPYVIFDDVADTGQSEMNNFFKVLKRYGSLDRAFRAVRITTAKKLIDDGIIAGDQLSE